MLNEQCGRNDPLNTKTSPSGNREETAPIGNLSCRLSARVVSETTMQSTPVMLSATRLSVMKLEEVLGNGGWEVLTG